MTGRNYMLIGTLGWLLIFGYWHWSFNDRIEQNLASERGHERASIELGDNDARVEQSLKNQWFWNNFDATGFSDVAKHGDQFEVTFEPTTNLGFLYAPCEMKRGFLALVSDLARIHDPDIVEVAVTDPSSGEVIASHPYRCEGGDKEALAEQSLKNQWFWNNFDAAGFSDVAKRGDQFEISFRPTTNRGFLYAPCEMKQGFLALVSDLARIHDPDIVTVAVTDPSSGEVIASHPYRCEGGHEEPLVE